MKTCLGILCTVCRGGRCAIRLSDQAFRRTIIRVPQTPPRSARDIRTGLWDPCLDRLRSNAEPHLTTDKTLPYTTLDAVRIPDFQSPRNRITSATRNSQPTSTPHWIRDTTAERARDRIGGARREVACIDSRAGNLAALPWVRCVDKALAAWLPDKMRSSSQGYVPSLYTTVYHPCPARLRAYLSWHRRMDMSSERERNGNDVSRHVYPAAGVRIIPWSSQSVQKLTLSSCLLTGQGRRVTPRA